MSDKHLTLWQCQPFLFLFVFFCQLNIKDYQISLHVASETSEIRDMPVYNSAGMKIVYKLDLHVPVLDSTQTTLHSNFTGMSNNNDRKAEKSVIDTV